MKVGLRRKQNMTDRRDHVSWRATSRDVLEPKGRESFRKQGMLNSVE